MTWKRLEEHKPFSVEDRNEYRSRTFSLLSSWISHVGGTEAVQGMNFHRPHPAPDLPTHLHAYHIPLPLHPGYSGRSVLTPREDYFLHEAFDPIFSCHVKDTTGADRPFIYSTIRFSFSVALFTSAHKHTHSSHISSSQTETKPFVTPLPFALHPLSNKLIAIRISPLLIHLNLFLSTSLIKSTMLHPISTLRPHIIQPLYSICHNCLFPPPQKTFFFPHLGPRTLHASCFLLFSLSLWVFAGLFSDLSMIQIPGTQN